MLLQESWILSPYQTTNIYLNLRLHEFEFMDNKIAKDIPSLTGSFFQLGSMLRRPYHPSKFPGELYRTNVFLQAESMIHKREVFNLLDLVGDLGGVLEVIILSFGFIFFPISE